MLAALCLLPALGAPAPASAAAAPTVWLSPSGDDAAPGTRAAPLRTLAAAWQRLLPRGGTAVLLGGVYATGGYLQLRGVSGGPVTIEAAAGARVAVADEVSLWGVRGLTLRDIRFAAPGRGLTGDWPLAVDGCSSHVRILDGSGLRFAVVQADHVLFRGGSWGGYGRDGDQDSMVTSDPSRCDTPAAPISHDITFDGITIHDVFWGRSSATLTRSHPDCLQGTGPVVRLTIVDSRFLRCSNSFLMFPPGDMGTAGLHDVLIEHNVFRGLYDSFFGIQLYDDAAGPACAGVVFRANVYEPGTSAPTGVPYAPLRIACRGPGHARIVDNRLAMRKDDQSVRSSRAAPWDTVWRGNRWLVPPR